MTPFTKDATWAINRNALESLPKNQITLFTCDVARLTLSIFEQRFPNDKRPRTAIETTELFVYGQATMDQLEQARSATAYAYATAYAAYAYATANAAYAAANTANTAYAAINAAIYATNAANTAYAAINAAATNAVNAAINAYPQILPTIQTIYQQTTPITIPQTPILKAIANHIIQTRNFQEYNILLDNLEEVHNITLERIIPLGLSHYVLYTLTNTH